MSDTLRELNEIRSRLDALEQQEKEKFPRYKTNEKVKYMHCVLGTNCTPEFAEACCAIESVWGIKLFWSTSPAVKGRINFYTEGKPVSMIENSLASRLSILDVMRKGGLTAEQLIQFHEKSKEK